MNAFVIDAIRKSVSAVTGRFVSMSCTPAALHVDEPAVLHDAPDHARDVGIEAVVLHRAIDLDHRRILREREPCGNSYGERGEHRDEGESTRTRKEFDSWHGESRAVR